MKSSRGVGIGVERGPHVEERFREGECYRVGSGRKVRRDDMICVVLVPASRAP